MFGPFGALLIVNGCVLSVRGLTIEEAEKWRSSVFAQDYKSDICDASDGYFQFAYRSSQARTRKSPLDICWSARGPMGPFRVREEQKALSEVSEEIARATRTVIKREAREAEVTEMIADNSRRIERWRPSSVLLPQQGNGRAGRPEPGQNSPTIYRPH